MVLVRSEVGRLRKVMVHAPGLEVDRMTPSLMEELLFDDIVYGDEARREHDLFRGVLERLGIECVDAQALLVEALAKDEAKDWLFGALFEQARPRHVEELRQLTPGELARRVVGGIRTDLDEPEFDTHELFDLPPVPNWCFQRDPQIVIGDGVVFCSMASPARWREVLLARTMFKFHADFSEIPVHLDAIEVQTEYPSLMGLRRPTFEGGDFLVVSEDVLALGLSERTNRTGVRQVARALSRVENGPRWLVVVGIPQERAFMHLDTILTPVDSDCALVYPPVILENGDEQMPVHEIDLRSKDLRATARPSILGALRERGVDLEPIPCGGSDPLDQQREQWTDGANAFALAPGVITLYDRNQKTKEVLHDNGFRIVDAEALLAGQETVDLDRRERVCILVPSHELSRARGGPHCLTQPLLRDPVDGLQR